MIMTLQTIATAVLMWSPRKAERKLQLNRRPNQRQPPNQLRPHHQERLHLVRQRLAEVVQEVQAEVVVVVVADNFYILKLNS